MEAVLDSVPQILLPHTGRQNFLWGQKGAYLIFLLPDRQWNLKQRDNKGTTGGEPGNIMQKKRNNRAMDRRCRYWTRDCTERSPKTNAPG